MGKNNMLVLPIMLAALFSRIDELTPFVLYGLIPFLTYKCYTDKTVSINENKYFRILSLLFLWIAITFFFASSKELATRNLKQLVGVYLFSYSVCKLSYSNIRVRYVYIAYLLCFISVLLYIQTHELLAEFDFTTDRIASDEDAGMNANEPAYFMFFASCSAFLLGEISERNTSRFYSVLFLLSIPMAFFIAIITGARQSVIIMGPTLLLLLYFRYIGNARSSKLPLLILGVILLLVIPTIYDIYVHSTLAQRSESSVQEDTRFFLLMDAFNVGLHHPYVGVGPGCYILYSQFRGFSHCSYVELFANDGAPAALIFIYMLFKYVRDQVHRYLSTKDRLFLIFLVIGIMYIVYNFFYVFYQSLWLMGFFFLIASHSDNYYKNINKYA